MTPAATVYICRVTEWRMLWLNTFVLFSCPFGSDRSYPWRFLPLAAVIVALVEVIAQASLRVSAGLGGLTVNFALRLTLTSGRTVTVSMPEPAAALVAMGFTP
ncbi:hypothetical protein [Nocardia sp. CS682]|uniref:hypothetical protein n=1 Tax=Nocardia sp. CS682 TaxID=1047172 RepID=UPI001074BC1C|nr:hypothetical protein [Nocardia sp. CS682]QBS39516.1 hypothetical protein DMB37_04580 [Nocardia sp. CS682]